MKLESRNHVRHMGGPLNERTTGQGDRFGEAHAISLTVLFYRFLFSAGHRIVWRRRILQANVRPPAHRSEKLSV